MNKQWIRIGNEFIDMNEIAVVDPDLQNHEMKLIMRSGVTHHIKRDNDIDFNLGVFNKFVTAIEKGNINLIPESE